MAMNAGTYKAPVTGRTAKKPFFTAKTPKGPGDHMEAPFVSRLAAFTAGCDLRLPHLDIDS